MKALSLLTAAAVTAASLASTASADTVVITRHIASPIIVTDHAPLPGYTPIGRVIPVPVPVVAPRPFPFPWPGPVCLSCPPLDLDDMRVMTPRVLVLR